MSPTKVLLIEDDLLIANGLQMLLEFRGFEVRHAGNGSEGMKLLSHFTPDLIITDMVMPVMDGTEVIRAVREQNPDIPVLAISGMGPEDGELYLKLARKLGANTVLRKPVHPKEVIAAIQRLMLPLPASGHRG
jgi:DNA-binding response OmpR family regulator